jgi:hypothetical protein
MTTNSLDDLALAEEKVERTRQRVTQSMIALRAEVSRQSDWRVWVARRPTAFVCAAFAVGFWLGHQR